ncbi:MAG: hypothetical protein ACOCQG_04015 [Candidatus Nanoarchaeia archaeon]
MDEKKLEEKLYSVREEVKNTIEKEEITLGEYEKKLEDLLTRECIIGGENDSRNTFIRGKIGNYFINNGPFKMYSGLKDNYITLKSNEIKSEQNLQDINNYNKVFELAKKYVFEKIKSGSMSKQEFVNDLGDYILSQPEVQEVDEKRQDLLRLLIPAGIAFTEKVNFKEEDYGATTDSKIEKALYSLNQY